MRLLMDLRKINTLLADEYANKTHPALCQMQHKTWQGSHYSASLTAPKLITACRWRTNIRWRCLHSILRAEVLPTKDLHKVFGRFVSAFSGFMREYSDPVVKADQCAQYVDDIGIAANNARIFPGTFGQCSSSLAKQD